MRKSSLRMRPLLSTLGIIIVALMSTLVIPVGSAMWQESLRITGDLSIGAVTSSPPIIRPTLPGIHLTPEPDSTQEVQLTPIATYVPTSSPPVVTEIVDDPGETMTPPDSRQLVETPLPTPESTSEGETSVSSISSGITSRDLIPVPATSISSPIEPLD